MTGFVPNARAYRVVSLAANGRAIFEALIDEIYPVRRSPDVGIFNTTKKKQRSGHSADGHSASHLMPTWIDMP